MKNDELAPEDDEEDEDSKNIVLPPPKMSINVHSSDPMGVTVTKTCLEVLNNLAKVGSRERCIVDSRLEKYVVKLLAMRCDLALQSYCYNDSFMCNTSSVSERDDLDQFRKLQSGHLVN